jgi:hypothetical protein
MPFLPIHREVFLSFLEALAEGDLAINVVSVLSERVSVDRILKRLDLADSASVVA